MIMEIATVVALARQCAPSVAVETLVSVVHTESHFDPLAIGINAKGVTPPSPTDRITAAAAARDLIARGYNIDLGLGQINSANLKRLGLSVEDAFDPCRNLAAAARVLSGNYLSVIRSSPTIEVAIATAMSMYNTGSRSRGFGNGYVDRVYASSTVVSAAIGAGKPVSGPAQSTTAAPNTSVAAPQPDPEPPIGWNTSAGAQTAILMVFGGESRTSPKGRTE